MIETAIDGDGSDSDPMEQMYRQARGANRRAWVENTVYTGATAAILIVGLVFSFVRSARQGRRIHGELRAARREGRDQPPSVHPLIDQSLCIGCGSCVAACPDHSVLGLVNGRAFLVNAANCIGHGRCAEVCPANAIELVFGTAKRPYELPRHDARYQSNTPGIYLAGELGGMGLIANALDQGVEAVERIAEDLEREARMRGDDRAKEVVDLLIVGAGPAGIGAALRARELKLRYALVEQDTWGGAVRSYPRAKLVMTRPMRLPLYGPVKLRETTKEALLELLTNVITETGLEVLEHTQVEDVQRRDGATLAVTTTRGTVLARRVLLAIGRRGTPRKLGVPGEDQMHVAYAMIEPERWAGKKLVVCGGGDVACEVALALSEQPGTSVTLIYRGKVLNRPKAANRERIQQAVGGGAMRLLLDADIRAIGADAVEVACAGQLARIPADQVFVCIGGQPPNEFLKRLGIETMTLRGQSIAAAAA